MPRFASLLPAFAMVACSTGDASRGVVPVAIEDSGSYWENAGFAAMTPPLRLPSRDGRERIAVWLKIPDGKTIRVEPRPDGGLALSYPAGTIADRADMSDGSDPRSVGDVRGTTFIGEGRELFHVLRRLDGDDSPRLAGVEWARDDAPAAREATDRMTSRVAEAEGLSADEAAQDPELRLLRQQNDCASCHLHGKPERTLRGARDATGGALPNRATDGAGLYVIATVLADGAPLETHRAREMNVEDPFVSVTCGADRSAPRLVRRAGGARHYDCDDGSVPYGRYDLPAALARDDDHARAVCRSRSYLFEHMDPTGQAAFASSFSVCGLGRPPGDGTP
jgi:hypothetical protein